MHILMYFYVAADWIFIYMYIYYVAVLLLKYSSIHAFSTFQGTHCYTGQMSNYKGGSLVFCMVSGLHSNSIHIVIVLLLIASCVASLVGPKLCLQIATKVETVLKKYKYINAPHRSGINTSSQTYNIRLFLYEHRQSY